MFKKIKQDNYDFQQKSLNHIIDYKYFKIIKNLVLVFTFVFCIIISIYYIYNKVLSSDSIIAIAIISYLFSSFVVGRQITIDVANQIDYKGNLFLQTTGHVFGLIVICEWILNFYVLSVLNIVNVSKQIDFENAGTEFGFYPFTLFGGLVFIIFIFILTSKDSRNLSEGLYIDLKLICEDYDYLQDKKIYKGNIVFIKTIVYIITIGFIGAIITVLLFYSVNQNAYIYICFKGLYLIIFIYSLLKLSKRLKLFKDRRNLLIQYISINLFLLIIFSFITSFLFSLNLGVLFFLLYILVNRFSKPINFKYSDLVFKDFNAKTNLTKSDSIEYLDGGRYNQIVKRKDVVHRPSGSWTPYVHDFLIYLDKVDFHKVPKIIGLDVNKNEIVSFIDGVVHNDLDCANMKSYKTLCSVAKLLREYHDHSRGFIETLSGNEKWLLPVREPIEVMCHGDFAPYNIVMKGKKAIGIIDFDTLHPGPVFWDIAYALYRWVPMVDIEKNKSLDDKDCIVERIDNFLIAYGLKNYNIKEVFQYIIDRVQYLVDFMIDKANSGDEKFINDINDGHHLIYLSDINYLKSFFANI